jgi:hypothetical protein
MNKQKIKYEHKTTTGSSEKVHNYHFYPGDVPQKGW